MKRNKIIIIISTIALGVIFGGAYWYLSMKDVLPTPAEMFPGEAGRAPAQTGEKVPPEEELQAPEKSAPLTRLYELHKKPVAGAGFAEAGSGLYRTVAARYIERGLGHIYETQLSTYAESRIVNETRSRIAEALWGNNGKGVVVRFTDDKTGGTIKTRILNIDTPTVSFARSTSTESMPGAFLRTEEIFLPDYIPFMATAEDGADKLFYLENGAEASTGSVATFKDADVSAIFNSSFTEWLPQFPNQKIITLTTKPSTMVPGYLYFIDIKTKALIKILADINGLTTLTSHDSRFVLYSETKGKAPMLSIYNTDTKETRSLNLETLPEKCAWGRQNPSVVYCAVPRNLPPGDYPDQWYQGVIAFSDDLWEINALTLGTKKIMSPSDLGAPFLDIINPILSSDDAYLLFMNKLSGTPWLYRISEKEPRTPLSVPVVVSTTTATTTRSVVPASAITSDMRKLK
ncbi:MAG: hypothetical protein WAV98_03710 [Minisyncoccia bacterium]